MNNGFNIELNNINVALDMQQNDVNIDLTDTNVSINIEDNNIDVDLKNPELNLDLQMGAQGCPGKDGPPGESAKINGVNTLNIEAGNNIQLSQSNDTLTISATGEVSADYNNLSNLPSINGTTIIGNKNGSDYGLISDNNYIHTDNNYANLDKLRVEGYTFIQGSPNDTWIIEHNLDKCPSCTIVNSAGDEVFGDVLYNSQNLLTITFNGAFAGKAYLN